MRRFESCHPNHSSALILPQAKFSFDEIIRGEVRETECLAIVNAIMVSLPPMNAPVAVKSCSSAISLNGAFPSFAAAALLLIYLS